MKTPRTTSVDYNCPIESRIMHRNRHNHDHHQSNSCCQNQGHHFHVHRIGPERTGQKKALWYCLVITLVMTVVELLAGHYTGSLMLSSDGLHMLSHSASLAVSLLAIVFATRKHSDALPFGWYRLEIIAALFNGLLLLALAGWIIFEALERLAAPELVSTQEMIFVAALGLVVNIVTAAILHRSGVEDLNTRSAYLHMLGDLFSSVVIVIGGFVMMYTGWLLIDPLLSTIVALVVLKWSWALLRDAFRILLEGKPDAISPDRVKRSLKNTLPEILDVHDLRIWEITSQYLCCTLHVVLEDMLLSDVTELKLRIRELLHAEFNMAYAVIQVECDQMSLNDSNGAVLRAALTGERH